MRWRGRAASRNIIDRRSGGGGGPSFAQGGKIGLGAVVVVIIALLLGQDPMDLLQQTGGSLSNPTQEQTSVPEASDEAARFVAVVLRDTEEVWDRLFREQLQSQYRQPELVLFSRQVQSACGMAGSATGPFYCPADMRVYIDLSFYHDLAAKLNAPGDFAMAYVIAHEVGHHVQRLTGITDQVHSRQGKVSDKEYNELSVRLELQADFFAGVWAHHAERMFNSLEKGDLEEALKAAFEIGDDRLQARFQDEVVPDSFTHGTSEQRMQWFLKGYQTGDVLQGDTFNAPLD